MAGVPSFSATLFYQKIHEMITAELENKSLFDGEIKIDESYSGEVRKGKRGRGAPGKVPVFGLLKRGKRFPKSLLML